MKSLKAQDFDDYFVIREELYPSFFLQEQHCPRDGVGLSYLVVAGNTFKCFPSFRSPDFNMTEFMNVTIHRKTTGCSVPDHLMYKTVSGSEKNPKITCPTISYYNWTAPVQWFKVKV